MSVVPNPAMPEPPRLALLLHSDLDFLAENCVKAVVYASAQLAEFFHPAAVLAAYIIACSHKLTEQSDIVPCEEEHYREGEEVSRRPPEAYHCPKKDYRQDEAERDRYECADCHIERT